MLEAQNVMVLFGTTGEKTTMLLETLKSAGLAVGLMLSINADVSTPRPPIR